MARNGLNLAEIFDAVLGAMKNKRSEINALDGFNGNHGDNMVQNIGLIKDAVESSGDVSPAAALMNASQKLIMAGKGGTSQYYANGLQQVAEMFTGRDTLGAEDGMTLVETLMGSIPAEGHPGAGESAASVLDMIASLSGQEGGQAVHAEGMGQIGDLMGMLGGLMGTGLDESADVFEDPSGIMDTFTGLLEGMQELEGDAGAGFDAGDLVKQLLPAGLDFLSAGQQDGGAAGGRMALVRKLLGAEPKQAHTPREGAARVIGRSILEYLLKRK